MNVTARLEGLLNIAITRGRLALSRMGALRTLIQATALATETGQDIELFLPYGMSALPAGGELIILRIAGRNHRIALCADDPSLRIADLQQAEFGHRDARGTQIVFRVDKLEITSSLPIVVNGNVTINGSLTATGEITAGQGGADQVALQTHKHQNGGGTGLSGAPQPGT